MMEGQDMEAQADDDASENDGQDDGLTSHACEL